MMFVQVNSKNGKAQLSFGVILYKKYYIIIFIIFI